MNKSELLDWLRKKHRQWEALLDQIGPRRMDLPGANGNWSMKDIVAHLTGWNLWLVTRLQAAQRGELEPIPSWPVNMKTEDEINEWIYKSNHRRPVREILDESNSVIQQLLAVIEGLPDDVRIDEVWDNRAFYLVRVGDQRFLPGELFDHFHDDHEPYVRAWLARADNYSPA